MTTGAGEETTGPPGCWILIGVALVVTIGVGEKGSWATVMVLAIGLSNDRGVNSGASGFSFDPYKQEVIRNCQRIHIKMILQRHLYLFLVARGCRHLGGLLLATLCRLSGLRSIFLCVRGSRSFRGVRLLRIIFVTILISVPAFGLDKNLFAPNQY